MKLNKKLLVLALSLVMLVCAFAVSALAADGEAGVLTVKYQDGTVETYAEGETITPPAVPKDFLVFEEGKAYKYTVTGTAWEGLPAAVTPELLGTTVNATVAGTKDARQVYYVTWEQLAADAPATKVYHMNNNVHEYLSSANTGDKGDGTNTGAAPFEKLGLKDTARIDIKLYADVDVENFAMNLFQSTRQYKAIPTYFDLNGHTVKSSQTGYIDGKSLQMWIYSSVPGAHWYMESANAIVRTNDDFLVAFGSSTVGVDGDEGNISFHCKAVFGDLYGSGAYIIGGKYYQTSAGSLGFVELGRRVKMVRNAEFHSIAGTAPLSDLNDHNNGPDVATGASPIQNCKFYCATETALLNATKPATIKLENCTFVNINLAPKQGTGSVTLLNGNVSNLSAGAAYGDLVLAHMDEAAVSFTAADGSAIGASVAYKSIAAAETLKITTSAGADYWTVGTTFSTSAGDYIKLENGKIYANPVYDLAEVAEIVDGKIAAAGEISLGVIFTKEDVAAFTYLDTKMNKLYGVGYEIDCGGTAAGVGEKFYELFYNPASAYTITMYKDMILSKAISFGPIVLDRNTDSYNRDYFNSCVNGAITWDLNGTTVTIPASVTGLVKMAAANCALTATGAGPTYSGNTFFGLEGSNKDNPLTLKSSLPGGKIVNESSAVLFGLGEGKRTPLIFEGENLTIVSPKSYIIFSQEANRDVSSASARTVINGGTYISGGATVCHFSMHTSLKDATFISTKADGAAVVSQDAYRVGNITVENCTFVAANAAAIAYKAGASNAHNLTLKSCTFVNCTPTTKTNCANLSSLTYEGNNVASTEDNLALIYASAPAGTAKVALDILVANAEGGVDSVVVYGYVSADQVLSVTYEGAGVTKNYLVGKVYAPIALDPAYFTVTFDLVAGTANIPVAWAGIPAAGIVTAGGTVTATPAENNVSLAFALYDNTLAAVTAYEVADSDAIGAGLAAALGAQANAGKLYVYADLVAPALTVAKDLEVLLTGKTLTLGGALTVAAPLTVEAGAIISAEAVPFVLSSDVTLSGTAVYLASATTVFGGQGNVALNNVVVYNLGAGAMADTAVVAINSAKLMGVSLGATVTVSGTVLGTAGTFGDCVYADGVVSGMLVNNNFDYVTVLGESYTVAYTEAATADLSKVINVTYEYKGAVRGNQKYFYASVASFFREYADGYYFEFAGEAALTEDVTYECTFRADANKVSSQVVLADALNYTFFLKVEDPGVLANLTLNGKLLDLAALEIVPLAEGDYYVIPVEFASFADALDNYVLSVDLVNGDETLTVTATAQLHTYLGEVLAAEDEAEAEKAYAVAGYVAALVSYFDYDFSFGDARLTNLSRVNNLLANYAEYKVEADLPDVTEITSAYVKSVVLVASEKVTFAFRVANSFAGTVEINGAEVAIEKPFEGFDRKYASVEVAFADLDEEITVVVKDAEGELLETLTYTLADYLAGVAAQNEGTVGEYAKALWNLSAVVG